jgi:ribosome maturation factor RimP
MAVLTVTITDPVFEKKSSEVAYLARVLENVAATLQRSQGNITSGNVLGVSSSGVPNTIVASFTYVASGTRP